MFANDSVLDQSTPEAEILLPRTAFHDGKVCPGQTRSEFMGGLEDRHLEGKRPHSRALIKLLKWPAMYGFLESAVRIGQHVKGGRFPASDIPGDGDKGGQF